MYSDNLAVKLKEASLATRFYAEILPPQWLIIDWWIVVLSILSGAWFMHFDKTFMLSLCYTAVVLWGL